MRALSRVLPRLVLVALPLVAAGCGGSTEPGGGGGGGSTVQLAQATGNAQTGTVGRALAAPIAARVTRGGAPQAGVVVGFAVTGGGGSVSAATATTDAQGVAQVTWTLGTAAGPDLHRVAASLAGAQGSPVAFSATAVADQPVRLVLDSTTNNQTGQVGTALTRPLAAQVTDQFGNGVAGITVNWTIASGAGTLSSPSAVTDADGRASVTWTLGATPGAQTVSATAPAVAGATPVTFTAAAIRLRITGFSADTLVPGQTVTISGEGFGTSSAATTVTVGGLPSSILSVTDEQLRFIVPAPCLPAGSQPVLVTVAAGTLPVQQRPFRPAAFTSVPLGRQVVLSDPAQFCLQFAAQGADEAYLVGVLNLDETPTSVQPVRLIATGAAPATPLQAPFFVRVAPPVRTGREAARTPVDVLLDRHRASHALVRAADARLMHGRRVPASAYRRTANGRLTSALAPAEARQIPTPQAIGDSVDVRFLPLSATLCSQFITLRTVVRFIGQRGIWLEDVANPTGGFTAADWQQSSDLFDQQLYAQNVANWGPPSDLDNNGRIFIVTTRRINEFNSANAAGVLAFVRGDDFRPPTGTNGCPGSNFGEVYYALAPDPQNVTGYRISVESARALQGILIGHEFTHILQYGQRPPVQGGAPFLSTWEAEGGATLTEQLIGFAIEGRDPAGNHGIGVAFSLDATGLAQPTRWYNAIWSDLSQQFGYICNAVGSDGNCTAPAKVPGAPEQCSFLSAYRDQGAPCVGTRAVYGPPSVLLRYLIDQYGAGYPGGPTALQAALIRGSDVGFANLSARLGVPASEFLPRFFAALYVDDRVPGLDPRLAFPSWNLQSIFEGSFTRTDGTIFQRLAERRLVPAARSFGSFQDEIQVRGVASSYTLIGGANRPATALRVTAGDGVGVLPSTMRVWVVRVR